MPLSMLPLDNWRRAGSLESPQSSANMQTGKCKYQVNQVH